MFPEVTTLIDDFNRADNAVDVGTSLWTDTSISGVNNNRLAVISNRLGRGTGNASLGAINYGPDIDLSFDVPVLPTGGSYLGVWWNVIDAGTTVFTAYSLILIQGTPWTWECRAYTDGGGFYGGLALTVGTGTSALVAGNKVGISQREDVIEFYRHDGVGWASVVQITDSSITPTAGPIAIELGDATQRLDNLLGGSLGGSTGDEFTGPKDVLSGSSDVFSGGSDTFSGPRDTF